MSENLEKTYNPKAIEAKLYEKWCDNKYFHAEVDRSKKPFTTVMPPFSTRKYTSLFVFLMNNGILPSGWLLSPAILTPFK